MTVTATPTSTLDRIAHWALDSDGDLYRDERERLRRNEGTTIAAALQGLAIPWIAAIVVWAQGRDTVVPLAAVLAALYLSTLISATYVQRRRVETTPTTWSRKRIVSTLVHLLPYLLFAMGAMYFIVGSATVAAAGVGVLISLAGAAVVLRYMTIRRRRRDAATISNPE